jgi:hypothetical protein
VVVVHRRAMGQRRVRHARVDGRAAGCATHDTRAQKLPHHGLLPLGHAAPGELIPLGLKRHLQLIQVHTCCTGHMRVYVDARATRLSGHARRTTIQATRTCSPWPSDPFRVPNLRSSTPGPAAVVRAGTAAWTAHQRRPGPA